MRGGEDRIRCQWRHGCDRWAVKPGRYCAVHRHAIRERRVERVKGYFKKLGRRHAGQ